MANYLFVVILKCRAVESSCMYCECRISFHVVSKRFYASAMIELFRSYINVVNSIDKVNKFLHFILRFHLKACL